MLLHVTTASICRSIDLLHDYAVSYCDVSTRRILSMAKDAGLRARAVTLSWAELAALREAYPVMAQLENGNWVVITNASPSGG